MKKENKNNEARTENVNPQPAKTRIYNLIVLDKSGSMSSIAAAAITGFNETLASIRIAQEKFNETQEHFVSLMIFCDCEKRLVYDKTPVNEVSDLTARDYRPCCGTPLYDAMGISLSKLRNEIQQMEDATAVVTIITDGMENASREYSGLAIKALVEDLKNNEGWAFSYIGTNQDVTAVSQSLSIDVSMTFDNNAEGMADAWRRERNAKMRHYDTMNTMFGTEACMSIADRKMSRSMRNKETSWFFDESKIADRITPETITQLAPNEILVFGSNPQGNHDRGSAKVAATQFGAIMGQAEGPQGRCYAIPTKGVDIHDIRKAVERFVNYATSHPDQKFLVTGLGSGYFGLNTKDIAELFLFVQSTKNICLPKKFWKQIL